MPGPSSPLRWTSLLGWAAEPTTVPRLAGCRSHILNPAAASVSHGATACLFGRHGARFANYEPRELAKFRTSLAREDAVFLLLLAKHET